MPSTLPLAPALPPDISSLLWVVIFVTIPPLLAAIIALWRREDARRDQTEKRLQADLDEEEALRVSQLKIIENHTASLTAHTNAISGLTIEMKRLTGALEKRRTR